MLPSLLKGITNCGEKNYSKDSNIGYIKDSLLMESTKIGIVLNEFSLKGPFPFKKL
jgi:hypothetical protein